MASHAVPPAPMNPPPGLINSAGSIETPKRREGDPPGLIDSVPKPDVESNDDVRHRT